jgi:hypothetical protein
VQVGQVARDFQALAVRPDNSFEDDVARSDSRGRPTGLLAKRAPSP